MTLEKRMARLERKLGMVESDELHADRQRDRATGPMAAIRYARARDLDERAVWKALRSSPEQALEDYPGLSVTIAAAWHAATQMNVTRENLVKLGDALSVPLDEVSRFEVMRKLADTDPLWYARRYCVMDKTEDGLNQHYEILGYPVDLPPSKSVED